MSALVVALFGGLLGALAPVLLIRANGRERRKDQLATWARDDEVARKAEEAARALLAAQHESIARTDEVAARLARSDSATMRKLDELDRQGKTIHALVNAKLTAVTEQALVATVALLDALEATAADQFEQGRPVPPRIEARIERARKEVTALRGTLSERAAQQAEIDAEVANQAGESAP